MNHSDHTYRPDSSELNPYTSPKTPTATVHLPLNDQPADRGLWARAIFGVWAGILFGGTFGAGGSALLAAVATIPPLTSARPPIATIEYVLLMEFMAVIAGSVIGLVTGGCIGPCVGLLTAINRTNNDRWVMVAAIVSSMLVGITVGMLGGYFLDLSDSPMLVTSFLAPVIGGCAGLLGGFCLGRGALSFAQGELS